jgi:predicted DNA-binding protein
MTVRPAKKRNRPIIQITLSPEAVTRLDEISERLGSTRSRMIESMVFGYKMPTPRRTT